MAYTVGLNMGITDRAILGAIKELQNQRNSFSYQDIADCVPCNISTVARTVPKLIESETIRRMGAKKNKTIRYEVIHEKS